MYVTLKFKNVAQNCMYMPYIICCAVHIITKQLLVHVCTSCIVHEYNVVLLAVQ